MRKLLKKVLPKQFVLEIRRVNNNLKLKRSYNNDFRKFKKSAFNLNGENSKENLRSMITFHYHSLEKGLSNVDFRLGFGGNALTNLFECLEEYRKKGYDTNDLRFKTGLSTIQEYIKQHRKYNYKIDIIEVRFEKLVQSDVPTLGGVEFYTKEDILNKSNIEFDKFAESRYSVRNFLDKPVDIELINKAIQTATKTPSVCNRQSWKVYVMNNGEIFNQVLKNQGGLTGFGQNMDKLIMITTDNNFFKDESERNQGYVDGGLFSMSLLYGLHSLGLATCMLNANLNKKKESSIKSILKISESENIILFIGVGHYPDSFKSPKSQRDTYQIITKYVN